MTKVGIFAPNLASLQPTYMWGIKSFLRFKVNAKLLSWLFQTR